MYIPTSSSKVLMSSGQIPDQTRESDSDDIPTLMDDLESEIQFQTTIAKAMTFQIWKRIMKVQMMASLRNSLTPKALMHSLKLILALKLEVVMDYSSVQNILPCHLDLPPVHADLQTNGEHFKPKISNVILPRNPMSEFQ
jgi:hypothetical protein